MINNTGLKSLILKTVNTEKWMFHSHDQNLDVEYEAHRKIDDYPHTKHPNDQLKLFIFLQN